MNFRPLVERHVWDWPQRDTKTVAGVTPFPSRTNAPFATRSARSRVVVAGEAPVIVLYFPAVSRLGTLRAFPEHAQECFFLPLIELPIQPIQQLCFVD